MSTTRSEAEQRVAKMNAKLTRAEVVVDPATGEWSLLGRERTVVAQGVGSYIAEATEKGDFPRIVLGVAMMSLFVTLFNRLFWRRLYAYAERRLRL